MGAELLGDLELVQHSQRVFTLTVYTLRVYNLGNCTLGVERLGLPN